MGLEALQGWVDIPDLNVERRGNRAQGNGPQAQHGRARRGRQRKQSASEAATGRQTVPLKVAAVALSRVH